MGWAHKIVLSKMSPYKLIWTLLNLGKMGNSMTPPSDLNSEKFEIGKNLEVHLFPSPVGHFGGPSEKKNKSLKHLKLPKNHFKTNLFFVQLNHLKTSFTFGKKLKKNYQKVQISNFGLFNFLCWPLPFWTFSTYCDIFFSMAPIMFW